MMTKKELGRKIEKSCLEGLRLHREHKELKKQIAILRRKITIMRKRRE